ncbi:MAG: class I SAM-dependent methyltransferase [Candidatus Heimdallarchaeota archaeon]
MKGTGELLISRAQNASQFGKMERMVMNEKQIDLCIYCHEISNFESDYPLRKGVYSNEGKVYRCFWHAQFSCSICGKFYHFSWFYWCPKLEMLICGSCNDPTMEAIQFWNKTYAYRFFCKECNGYHHDLLYTEFQGIHPLQKGFQIQKMSIMHDILEIILWKPEQKRNGKEISLIKALKLPNAVLPIREKRGGVLFHSDLVNQSELTQNQIYQQWEKNSGEWIRHHEDLSSDDKGDINRQLLIDPALWKLIGDPSELKILDAGCGNGYLSRELARKGAKIVGIDHSTAFIEYCIKKEQEDPLGCDYVQASLDNLEMIASLEFDLVISNIVFVDVLDYETAFNEISRVLKTDGRFIWSNLHPVFGRTSIDFFRLPYDTPRNEERLYVMIDRYFDSGGRLISWGNLEPLWQFDRTLSEYSGALKKAGFVIQEIIEPKPELELIKQNPRLLAFDADRIPFFIIFDCFKKITR